MDRRQFLGAAAVSVASLRPVRAAGEESAVLPIVDTHQHLWDLNKFRLPWHKPGSPLARTFLMSDYLEATRDLNVVKTVYMEVDLDVAQQVEEAEYVTDICRRGDSPMRAAVISGRPASDGFKDYIVRFQGNPYIKGVR